MRILISGAGVAGPTLAWWLARDGFTPTLVESAPRLRTGGYVIDFWGPGFEIANRMGMLPSIRPHGYIVREIRVVDDRGRTAASLPTQAFFKMTQGQFLSISRGDLAACIYDALDGKVETLFGDRVVRLEQSGSGVDVGFASRPARHFDLVVGCDGPHSGIRQLVYGDESQFEKYLGFKVAAFEVRGYALRDELVYMMHTGVGRQIARFSMRDDRTMFLFTFRDEDRSLPATLSEQKALLRDQFGRMGWETPRILDALDRTTDLYIDRVSQIHMGPAPDSWSRGRVTLLGDAAFAVSILAGQGTALSMIAAYILAGELRRAGGDHTRAFLEYQQRFGPFVLAKQKAATRLAGFFAPRSQLALFARNKAMSLMKIPWIADLAIRRDIADRLELPDY
jgi:2-polyprenyl-6-methoxyphenol hydroxylase-like FAD-dependent oxidoreductase